MFCHYQFLNLLNDEKFEIISISDIVAQEVDSNKQLSFTINRAIPKDYTLIAHGILYTTNAMYGTESAMLYGTTGVLCFKSISNKLNGNYVFTLKISESNLDRIIYARGYAIITDNLTGEQSCVYSDIVVTSYNNEI